MRKQRSDFDETFAKSLYLLRQSGLSVNEIAFNPNYNTKNITPQRISKIIITYTRKLNKEKLENVSKGE